MVRVPTGLNWSDPQRTPVDFPEGPYAHHMQKEPTRDFVACHRQRQADHDYRASRPPNRWRRVLLRKVSRDPMSRINETAGPALSNRPSTQNAQLEQADTCRSAKGDLCCGSVAIAPCPISRPEMYFAGPQANNFLQIFFLLHLFPARWHGLISPTQAKKTRLRPRCSSRAAQAVGGSGGPPGKKKKKKSLPSSRGPPVTDLQSNLLEGRESRRGLRGCETRVRNPKLARFRSSPPETWFEVFMSSAPTV